MSAAIDAPCFDRFAAASEWLATPGSEESLFTTTALEAVRDLMTIVEEGGAPDIPALANALRAPRNVVEAFVAFAEWRLGVRGTLQ